MQAEEHFYLTHIRYMNYPRLLKMPTWKGWDHHRSGWRYVLEGLQQLHNDDGIWFNSFLDQYFINKKIEEPWTGFFHNTPFHPSFTNNEKYLHGKELDAVLDSPKFRISYPYCRGLFTLANYTKEFLETRISAPVTALIHPTEEPDLYFSYESFINNPNKKLVVTGQWLRRYETIYFIPTIKYEKCILDCDPRQKWNLIKNIVGGDLFDQVTLIKRISNAGYDLLLERNIVFLDLYDAAACNSIIDCIIRNTPVLTRKNRANIEYLGEKYPFYFRDIDEATQKIHDMKLIRETTKYLERLPIKQKMTLNYFVQTMVQSVTYKSLIPRKVF